MVEILRNRSSDFYRGEYIRMRAKVRDAECRANPIDVQEYTAVLRAIKKTALASMDVAEALSFEAFTKLVDAKAPTAIK